MTGELDQIVQRMIDAGEPEENIATVIQGYQPAKPERSFVDTAVDALPTIGGAVGGSTNDRSGLAGW